MNFATGAPQKQIQSLRSLSFIERNENIVLLGHEILSIEKSYPVIFVSNPNKHGAASTRNYGVSIAKGTFVTFLDDDDIYLPNRLNNMLTVMRQGKYIMVSSGRFYETGDFSTIKAAPKQYFGEISLNDIKYQNDIDIGFMMRREDFIRFGGFDISYKSLEDWDFILRVLEHGNCYKIKRMDYAVNIDPSRVRVSNNDSASYLKMADRYKDKYEREWVTYMSAHGLSLAGKLKFSRVLRDCRIKILICYLKQIKRRIFK